MGWIIREGHKQAIILKNKNDNDCDVTIEWSL